MSAIYPVNDTFKVEVASVEDNPLNLVGGKSLEEGVRTGIVRAISDKYTFFGYITYSFDQSLMNTELLDKIFEHYKQYVGKRVYWPEYSEKGSLVEEDGKTYAFIKCSAIMAAREEE